MKIKKCHLLFYFALISLQAKSQQRNYSLKTSSGVSYSFFKTSTDVPSGVSLLDPFAAKPFGYFYNIELQVQNKKGLIYEYGYSHHEYSKYVKATYDNTVTIPSIVSGRMFHKLHIFHFGVNKPYKLKNNNFISLGLGINIPMESNQFFESQNGNTTFSLIESYDLPLGSQFQIRYEKQTKQKFRLGLEAKFIALLIPLDVYSISFGPYLRVNL
jgi:hypothetical protein